MQNYPVLSFWIIFIILVFAVIYCDRKYCMLKDKSIGKPPPYSWARVQLAWWSVIVMASFVAVIIKYHVAPTLNESTVILIGISAATIATARVIDVNEENDPNVLRHQDKKGTNLFIDIISDQSGPSIHRFQTVVFNIIFGVYFIGYVLNNLSVTSTGSPDEVMPLITTNNLILLGLSSATYAALKTTENKTATAVKKEEAENNETTIDAAADEPAVG